MDNSSNNGLRLLLGILVVVLLIGIIALLFLVFNSYNGGGGPVTATQGAPTALVQTPVDVFPTNSPTKDTSKIIISEIRNGSNNSIASVSLMVPPTLIGLTAEVNGQPVTVAPVDASTVRLDMPAGLDAQRLEIQFKAGSEVRSSCVLDRSNVQHTEGDCIW